MTRRIVLTLADDVTKTECVSCDMRESYLDPPRDTCLVFGDLDQVTRRNYVKRHDRCLAAEAAASRLVEIAPDDADTIATIVDDWNRRCLPYADLPESIARIRDVLRDHAGEFRG